MRRIRLASMLLAVATLSLVLSSCSKHPKLYPVSGKVLCDGEPAEGAIVTFYPETGHITNKTYLPQGVANADGVFKISTYRKDGAPVGKYKVTVIWTQKMKDFDSTSDDNESILLTSETYCRPDKSGLNVDVKAEPNNLPAFQLKSDD